MCNALSVGGLLSDAAKTKGINMLLKGEFDDHRRIEDRVLCLEKEVLELQRIAVKHNDTLDSVNRTIENICKALALIVESQDP